MWQISHRWYTFYKVITSLFIVNLVNWYIYFKVSGSKVIFLDPYVDIIFRKWWFMIATWSSFHKTLKWRIWVKPLMSVDIEIHRDIKNINIVSEGLHWKSFGEDLKSLGLTVRILGHKVLQIKSCGIRKEPRSTT
jgi:hypothetical protein